MGRLHAYKPFPAWCIKHLLEVEEQAKAAEESAETIKMRRKPSKVQTIAYRLQLVFFVLSFLLITDYLIRM